MKSMTLAIILQVLLCLVVQVEAQTNPRKFYKYDVVATSSSSLSVGNGPSINDYGDVAFAGRLTGGTVFLSEIGQPNVNLMPGSSADPSQFVGPRVQINNSKQVIEHTTLGSANLLQRINGVEKFHSIGSYIGRFFNNFPGYYCHGWIGRSGFCFLDRRRDADFNDWYSTSIFPTAISIHG